jgi:hypothetical protein
MRLMLAGKLAQCPDASGGLQGYLKFERGAEELTMTSTHLFLHG